MGKCKFRPDWLLKKDNNGHELSTWASKHSESEVFCRLCVCTIEFQTKGFHALLQHSSSSKHMNLSRQSLGPTQMVLAVANPSSSGEGEVSADSPVTVVRLFSTRDKATVSELIWTMKSICINYSAASTSGLTEAFKAMFPGGVPEGFSLSPKKMHYLTTEALGPYFHQILSDDIKNSYFTVSFDETTNVEDRKELQTTVRYWSESSNSVISRHLQTFFIGKADAQTLHEKIHSAISNANLPLQRLLMIGSDGPNVNKHVKRLFNEDMIELRTKGLLDIGSCPIHTVHNAYLHGLEAFGEDASELATAVHNYFAGWPA